MYVCSLLLSMFFARPFFCSSAPLSLFSSFVLPPFLYVLLLFIVVFHFLVCVSSFFLSGFLSFGLRLHVFYLFRSIVLNYLCLYFWLCFCVSFCLPLVAMYVFLIISFFFCPSPCSSLFLPCVLYACVPSVCISFFIYCVLCFGRSSFVI